MTAFTHEEYNVSRKKATAWIIATCFVLATVCSLSIGPWKDNLIFGRTVFDLFDFVSANILLPLGGLLISIFVGYRLDKQIIKDELSNNGKLKLNSFRVMIFILKYVAPVAIILIFLSGLNVI